MTNGWPKLQAVSRSEMRRLASALTQRGAEALIAGCTEVPLLLTTPDAPAPLTDSAEALARACVKACIQPCVEAV